MPRKETARWKFSYGWLRGEDWWGDPVSDNFVKMDMLLHPWVLSAVETVPPSGFAVGDMYIVAPGGSGDWEGRDNNLAVATALGWVFCEPMQKGIRAGCEAPADWLFWNGTAWVTEGDIVIEPPAPAGTRYDVCVSVGFEAEPLEFIAMFTAPEDMTWPSGAPGSRGRTMIAPTAVVEIAVKRNPDGPEGGEQIGTIRYIPGSTFAEIIVIGNKAIPAGTQIGVQMPQNVPPYFKGYSTTMRFLLNN